MMSINDSSSNTSTGNAATVDEGTKPQNKDDVTRQREAPVHVDAALTHVEDGLRRPHVKRAEGAEVPWANSRAASPEAPRPQSRVAFRNDGKMFLSLEDAVDRDFTGRRIVCFLELTPEETARMHAAEDDSLSAAAASIIGGLPTARRGSPV